MTLEELREKAEAGDAEAQHTLGECYHFGIGVEKDETRSLGWTRRAAMQGYAEAQNNLGGRFLDGIGVERDEACAAEWFRKAAERNFAAAQHNLGYCYLHGRGVEKNEAQAFLWFRKAAEQGYAAAQNNMGSCYCNGYGVEKDEIAANEWFRKAAEAGYAKAQTNLGISYYRGRGIGKSYERAAEWFEKAAAQQQREAEYMLGECHYLGYGRAQNFERAAFFYQAAANRGHAEARCRLLEMAARGLCPQTINAVWLGQAAEEGYPEAQIAHEKMIAAENARRAEQQAEAEKHYRIANAFGKHHVFLSWNHNDLTFKNRLVKGIEQYAFYGTRANERVYPHFRAWESDRDGEGGIEQCIKNAIARSACFVVLLSEHSVKSSWVRKEVSWALEKVDRGEWQEEDIIVVCLDGKAEEEIAGREESDPFVRIGALALKYPGGSNEERIGNVCLQIKNCLERKTCERFLKRTREECLVYNSTIYGQITRKEQRLLKGCLSMDGAYLAPEPVDTASQKRVPPQEVLQPPHSFWLCGGGGVGKSLFVRFLIKNYMGKGRIFIRLNLSDAEVLSGICAAESLQELLNAEINRYAEDGAGRSEGAFARLAKSGGVIYIVLDGMDGLDGERRKKLQTLVRAHLETYSTDKFIFVSRSQEQMSGFDFDGKTKCYRLDGFRGQGDAEKLYDAIVRENENYLSCLGGGSALRRDFFVGMRSLPEEIGKNPLLLSNLILIWLQSGGEDFPAKKYGILKKSAEIFLDAIADSWTREGELGQYLRGKGGRLFEAVAYRRVCGDPRKNETLLAEMFGEWEGSAAFPAEETARKAAEFFTRRKIFCAVGHDVFTAYFASSYLYHKIYTLRETRPRLWGIVFCNRSSGEGMSGKRRLRVEMKRAGSPLFTETAVDVMLMLDSEAHFYCAKREMDGRHPSYAAFSRTLKTLSKQLPQGREVLFAVAREEENLWYGEFIEERLRKK